MLKKKWNIPTKFEKNRTKQGNPYYLVLFENRTKPGTVLSETVLSGDSLYIISTTYVIIIIIITGSPRLVRFHLVRFSV